MFKILGGDGKEYGPVTIEQVKQWVREGRANHETMAQPSGAIGWKPLAQYPEFADLFGAPAPAPAEPAGEAPPPAPAAAPAAGIPAMVSAVAPVAGGRGRAERLVRGPAIGLIVTAALGIASALLGIILNSMGTNFMPPTQNMPPQTARLFQMMFHGPFLIGIRILGIVVCAFILFGGLQMMKLRSYGLALTASIVAMVPCFSPCCILGLPIGIWALVVLSQSEVRAQFDRPAGT